MRYLGIGFLTFLALSLVAYKMAAPFTPVWVDLAFIGVCLFSFLVMHLVMRNKTSDGPKQ